MTKAERIAQIFERGDVWKTDDGQRLEDYLVAARCEELHGGNITIHWLDDGSAIVTADEGWWDTLDGAVEAGLTVDDLVGVAEVADRLRWDRRKVATYISRGSFPEPIARLAMGPVWRWSDVETVAKEKGWIEE